jgi:hypothetical protein
MGFPLESLRMLYEWATGKKKWDTEVFDALIEVVKYAYSQIDGSFKADSPEMLIEEALQAAIEEGSGVKTAFPGLWLAIGSWALKMLIEHLNKKG